MPRLPLSTLLIITTLSSALVAACSIDTRLRHEKGGTTNGIQGLPSAATPTGVPCEIAQVLASADGKCTACHSSPPVSGAPMSLVSYADLMAPSPSDPSISNAQAALQRMQDPMSPMPPSPLSLSAAEIQTFQTWVNTGMPQADCSAPPAPPPNIYDTPVTCSSGTHWTQGTNGSAAMKPGGACINCHTKSGGGGEDEAPRLTLGGTVYRTAHEPDDCNGTQVNTGDPPGSGMDPLEVQIFDPNGNPSVPVLTIQVNGAGNFSSQSPIPNPFTAAVVDTVTQDARVMALPQKSGDCNGCHTVSGINTVAGAPKAPGRIMAP